jgi:hypothetical protein
MGLDWQPESNESLAARFDDAMSRIYDADAISEGQSDRPGQHRENVFDFEDGFRVIVSYEKHDGDLYIHVSGSAQDALVPPQDVLRTTAVRAAILSAGKIQGQAKIALTKRVVHLTFKVGPEWISRAVRPNSLILN